MLMILIQAPFSAGPKSFLRHNLAKTQAALRGSLLAIAFADLAFIIPAVVAALGYLFFRWQVGLAAGLTQWLGEGELVFLLGDNRISGVAFGILLGALSALILRRVWLGLVFCSLGFAAGVLALNWGWGLWMGTLLGFWLHQALVFRAWPLLRGAFRFRVLITVVTILLIFRFSDPLAIALRNLEVFELSRDNRFFQWLASGALTLTIDSAIAAVFFHFYNFQQVTNHEGRRR